MKPIIGINVDIEESPTPQALVQSNYFLAVEKAGGIPLLVPPMSDDDLIQILGWINGLMLIGGNDYDPLNYFEPPSDKVKLAAKTRDDFDMRLIQRAVVERDLPLLGICAGCQALNIGLGGSLIQDIPSDISESKVGHTSVNGWEKGWNQHMVRIDPTSKLSDIYGRLDFSVPTSHHQAVKRLGKGLKATAHAEDGIIEAIEYTGKPFTIGVQWHPERDFEGNKPLFEAFVKHASTLSPVGTKY